MITQNPITGRSRKKLAGVYARTLWGQNVIQSCPTHSTIPPTQALSDSRAAFKRIQLMANQVPSSLLNNIYYTAPVGRSRRHVLSSQLFAGVLRDNLAISFSVEALTQLGTNPVTTQSGTLYTVLDTSFTLPVSRFNATQLADTSRVPCVFAISYDLQLCVPLLSYTTLEDNMLAFTNLSETFLGQQMFLLALWQTNIGTSANPVWVYGRFQEEN